LTAATLEGLQISLSVISGPEPRRTLEPPSDLSAAETQVFHDAVLSYKPGHFQQSNTHLLAAFSKACCQERLASEQLATDGAGFAASTSIVASQRPRNTAVFKMVAREGVARFLQCANEMFGNALPLLLNVLVKFRRVGFARRRLPNVPHDNPRCPAGASPRCNSRRLGGEAQLTNP
jgi:hypothetical protein